MKTHHQSRLLLVDDEEGIRFTLGSLLRKEGYLVDVADGIDSARSFLKTSLYDLIFVDIMLGEESGMDLLYEIKSSLPSSHVVMLTGYPKVDSAIEAVRLGAFDYVTKPVRYETLIAVTRHALNNKQFHDNKERNRANLDAIFRTVTDGIVMVDSQGNLVHFNPAAERFCGYQKEQLGSDAAIPPSLCGGTCREAVKEALTSNSVQKLQRIECRLSQGSPRIVTISVTPVAAAEGGVSGAVVVIRDETHLVELENSIANKTIFQGIIGSSTSMQRIYRLIESLADVPTTVLINGESGTGKELVAAALHTTGKRSKAPFVKVNCSALSEHLLESELFGHVRGAFTGAIADKIGRFEKADGGTLFLDEIGDISPAVQMRLLRVLQEQEFERVGDATPVKVDVRIVAATNQNLAEKVRLGSFRQDLYYRLNVVRLELPPLRERHEDLEALVGHFILRFNSKLSKAITTVSDDVMKRFHVYSWPGNVRELEHAIEHASILSTTSVITVVDLPQDLLDTIAPFESGFPTASTRPLLPQSKLSIDEALAASDGNKARAARLLGISRMTLYRHMESASSDTP